MPTEPLFGPISVSGIHPALRRRLCLLAALLMVAGLFLLGRQSLAVGLFLSPWDKLAHAAVFALIAALLWTGFGGRRPWTAIFLASVVGMFDEWHQSTLPGRQADLGDLLVDVAAACCAVALLQAWQKAGAMPRW